MIPYITNGQGAGNVRQTLNDAIDVININEAYIETIQTDVDTLQTDVQGTVQLNQLYLTGVKDIKSYVAKVNNTTISIAAGEGLLRKNDGLTYEVSWSAVSNQVINVPLNELRWLVFEWDVTQTSLVFNTLTTLPETIDEFEKIILIGRAWDEDGTLTVSDKHLSYTLDLRVPRDLAWIDKSKNISVSATYSSANNNHLAINGGELFRWPIVESLQPLPRHIHLCPAISNLTRAWESYSGQTDSYRVLTDNGLDDATDIDTIADYYDNNGTISLVSNNNFAAHKLGIYAVSNEVVWFRGTQVYNTMDEAVVGYLTQPFPIPSWAADFDQISMVAVVILKRGARDFSIAADCKFIQLKAN